MSSMPEITVTSWDLANGRPTPSANPLARAVRRAFPGARWVTAGLGCVQVCDRDGQHEHQVPDKVSAALASWCEWPDRAKPFRFTLPDGHTGSGAAA